MENESKLNNSINNSNNNNNENNNDEGNTDMMIKMNCSNKNVMMMNLPQRKNLREPATRRVSVQSNRKVYFTVILRRRVCLRSSLSTLNSRFTYLVDMVRKAPQIYHRLLSTFLQMHYFPRYGIETSFAKREGKRLLTTDDRRFFLRVMFLFQNHPT